VCLGYWSTFTVEEQKRVAQEKAEKEAEEKRLAEEKAAAEKKAAQEKAAADAAAAAKKLAEKQAEAAKMAEEAKKKAEEAKNVAEEAQNKFQAVNSSVETNATTAATNSTTVDRNASKPEPAAAPAKAENVTEAAPAKAENVTDAAPAPKANVTKNTSTAPVAPKAENKTEAATVAPKTENKTVAKASNTSLIQAASCATRRLGVFALLSDKAATLGPVCEEMCKEMGVYPACQCPGFAGQPASADDNRACIVKYCQDPTNKCPNDAFATCVEENTKVSALQWDAVMSRVSHGFDSLAAAVRNRRMLPDTRR
jgi:chemotaxis protein histidine kinase CheA